MSLPKLRKSGQSLLPPVKPGNTPGRYNIYPSHILSADVIFSGYQSLAVRLAVNSTIIIDGYTGVWFEDFKEKLDNHLKKQGVLAAWIAVDSALKEASEIQKMVSPFLGDDDPLFGRRTDLQLNDFFNHDKLLSLKTDNYKQLNIIYGPGAALSGWNGFLVYIDLPKNELQYRARAGSCNNLGSVNPTDSKSMYKRFYFVDWVVLNKHKQSLVNNIDIIIDGQRPDDPSWMEGNDLRAALEQLSKNVFRVRPWFEAGAWGGQWMKYHLDGLNTSEINYAWSFELIVPENGLILESSGRLLEVSFDFLMYFNHRAILGRHAEQYKMEFPIRFDFLDTFSGGNLSVQCHPQTGYIREYFGENFTQEESYYILDAGEDAVCYLGFQAGIDPDEFRERLENSFRKNEPVTIDTYVQVHPSGKHDLFLIPPGTIHGSGRNNLVLEISTTPYIFTFKMYDWLRPDLDGRPRPLNIDRGMANLCFDRQGDKVISDLLSKPVLLKKGTDWECFDLPTHKKHSYAIHRYQFNSEVFIETDNRCNVLNLVEGTDIIVKTANGMCQHYNYAETFVIPAAANSYRIINCSGTPSMIVIAFLK